MGPENPIVAGRQNKARLAMKRYVMYVSLRIEEMSQ